MPSYIAYGILIYVTASYFTLPLANDKYQYIITIPLNQ